MKKKLGVLALVAASALALTSCASNGDPGSSGAPAADAKIRVWLVGTDTPKEAREYLTTTFEKENPGSKLIIEEQSWTGLVDKLNTNLSGSDSPDVVEVGNTQAAAFTSAGAFLDLTKEFDSLGGKDLLPGFVEAGSYDGKFYAAPLYSGARLVFFKKDALSAAGLTVPTTLADYVSNGKKLAADNAGKSGIWWPGQDWYNALPFIWENGGEVATFKDGKWSSAFSTANSLEGLKQVQDAMVNASRAPKDGKEDNPQVGFCDGTSLQLSAPSWVKWSILAPADSETPGCPDQEENLGVYALPGKDGGAASVMAGGSNIAVSNKSKNPELATKALKIILSDEFQTIYAKNGLVPAKLSLAKELGTDEVATATAEAAGKARLTPPSPKWADVEAAGLLQDFFVKIAQGGDVESLAKELDKKIDGVLNG
ncbi:extracellular solute-binding protein [Mycetocola tolaasinivorans]|uniref:Extracellular solute-binding protein n=1 Tax=Mycetocola tolaasinivorans TaxID=76635 RepID=A0A3L7A7E7_9MICO|nr:extracellular solute-binding protein [Mycetocola tolaasinivorans]RLP75491.1 extracellular solute-binding protein [Mycetocola tolaasinivorans]